MSSGVAGCFPVTNCETVLNVVAKHPNKIYFNGTSLEPLMEKQMNEAGFELLFSSSGYGKKTDESVLVNQ